MELFNIENIIKFRDIIKNADKIVISTHIRPDGDAVGSSVCMASYLLSKGKTVKIIFPSPLTTTIDSLLPDKIRACISNDYKFDLDAADTLISLDYNGIHRTGDVQSKLEKFSGVKVLIDHHLNPDTNFYNLIFSTEYISSASELVFWVILALENSNDASILNKISKEWAMLGMTTDTNDFANSTYPSTFKMASLLIEGGVDRDMLIENLYKRQRENRYRLLGYILDQKLKINDCGVAYVVLSKKELDYYDIKEGDTEGFVNIPLEIERVRLSILVKEDQTKDGVTTCRVSLRSKMGVSANILSNRFFNGGGHELAAGGSLRIPLDVNSFDEIPAYIENNCKL